MTRQEFYELVATRVQAVVADTKIWRAYQDAAPPSTGVYIAIDDGSAWKRFGTATLGATDGEERQIRHDCEVTVVFWEVRGDGELLQQLLESFDTRASLDYFHAAGVGVLRTSDATKMPEVLDTAKYTKRTRAEVIFSAARVSTEAMLNIASIEYTPAFTHETEP